MKLNQQQFKLLSLDAKAAVVWNEGEYICSREYYLNRSNLYALPGFLVEVSYNPRTNLIDKINTISDVVELNKYLPSINLPTPFDTR